MRWWLLAIAGCWSASPIATPVAVGSTELVVSETGVGPLDAKTSTALTNLRTLLPRYHVAPRNDVSLHFDIYDGKDLLGFIATNDDGTIFNIHISSGKVRVAQHDWRAGKPFQDSKYLSTCLCWGDRPMCFKQGEHVGLTFDRSCVGDDPHSLRALDGLIVQRVVWSAMPFGVESAPTEEDRD